MALTDPRVVALHELRFKPANSNDRARVGLEHAFRDVPKCSFARDDGISPYISADSGISDHPDSPAGHTAIHDDVPEVVHEQPEVASAFIHKLPRSGFALSVFLHAVIALGLGYATLKLPNDSALLEGETVIAV